MDLISHHGYSFPELLLYYGNLYMEDDMNLDVKRLIIAIVAMIIFVAIFIITSGN
jgi:hypothetical protein